jgi:hypothetical protein
MLGLSQAQLPLEGLIGRALKCEHHNRGHRHPKRGKLPGHLGVAERSDPHPP